ncbi:MAG: hypothetical protein NXI30_06805 [bacterium]|nr:hypothetical protein [bacterium]
MRRIASLIAGCLVFVCAGTAVSALHIEVTSDVDPLRLIPDSDVTFTITLTTDLPGEARGLTLRAAGLGDDLAFRSATVPNFGGPGSPNGEIFGRDIGFGFISDGIESVLPGPIDNGDNVVLFDGVSTLGTYSAGPEVFTLTLRVIGFGAGAIEVGALRPFGDAYVSDVDGTSYPVVSIPYAVSGILEPGPALLVGLGLTWLGAVGRPR